MKVTVNYDFLLQKCIKYSFQMKVFYMKSIIWLSIDPNFLSWKIKSPDFPLNNYCKSIFNRCLCQHVLLSQYFKPFQPFLAEVMYKIATRVRINHANLKGPYRPVTQLSTSPIHSHKPQMNF